MCKLHIHSHKLLTHRQDINNSYVGKCHHFFNPSSGIVDGDVRRESRQLLRLPSAFPWVPEHERSPPAPWQRVEGSGREAAASYKKNFKFDFLLRHHESLDASALSALGSSAQIGNVCMCFSS